MSHCSISLNETLIPSSCVTAGSPIFWPLVLEFWLLVGEFWPSVQNIWPHFPIIFATVVCFVFSCSAEYVMLVRRRGALNWPGYAVHYVIVPQLLDQCSYSTHLPILIFNHDINVNWKNISSVENLLQSNFSGSIDALVPSNC